MALALRIVEIGGLLASIAVTALGLLVDRWPLFELLNHGRPAVVLGVLVIAGLAVLTGRKPLMIAAASIVAANIGLFVFALQGTATAAGAPAKRFARIVTFNVWMGNRHMDEVAKFLNDADADVVVLEELMPWQRDGLRYLVKDRYPYSIGRYDVVMFSKYPIKEAGEIRGASDNPRARRAMLTWTTVEISGMTFDIAGVHNAYPFNALDQAAYMPTLIEFARDRERLLIVAGDFNLTPWSVKLQRFGSNTGLRRFNTFTPTWPMNRRTLPPFVAIDNIFASPEFALIDIKSGPALGSDHRPLVADIALAK
ncbi:MAG: endonuclease/exonuclease/phosphatase family protein [Xanthobacteraceae bacterium]